MTKSNLRRRITPFVPFSTTVENADGGKFELNFKLSFNFNAMSLVEEQTGLSMLTGEVFEKPSAKNTTILLWAAIQENHPEYEGQEGLETIGSYLTLASAKEALSAIQKAFVASLPKDKAEQLAKGSAEGGEDPNAQAS
jgi:hypothetical protein